MSESKGSESLHSALDLALAEDRGALIVAMYEMNTTDLANLVEAAQLIDAEGVEILDGIESFDSEFVPGCDTEGS